MKRKLFPAPIPMAPEILQPQDLLPSWKPLWEAVVFLNEPEPASQCGSG